MDELEYWIEYWMLLKKHLREGEKPWKKRERWQYFL
jgi:hypothetical protein